MVVEWWTDLGLMMQILWGVTIVATILFIIQNFTTFLRDGVSKFPYYNAVVNFFLGFGWTSVLMSQRIQTPIYLFIIAAIVGAALAVLVAGMGKMLDDNANK
ncbi:MAG: hypothetical protein K5984_06720 [Bacteroidales bacterium]|nr:hypothetical protein [Bacteroidales bacterium]